MTRPAPAGTSGSADAAPSAHVLLLFTVVVLSWGTSWLPIRYQIDEALPEVTLFWRFAGADVLLWGLVWWRGAQWRYPPGVHLRLVLMGCSMFGVNYLVMYNAAYDLPTGMLAVIFSTASLYGFAFDALFFGRRTGPRALAGVAVGFAGLTLVFLPQVTGTAFNAAMAHAFGLAIVATAMFATGSSFAAATQKRGVSVRGSAAWACLYGSIAMALIVVARGGDFSVPLKTTYLLSLGWHIVVATAIALSVMPRAKASPSVTRPEGIGRLRVRFISRSISASHHMLSAPDAPPPMAMNRIAASATTGWTGTGATTRPTSAVKTTSDMTRGLSSAK